SNVEDGPAAVAYHVSGTGLRAVVVALDIDAHDAVEIGFAGGFHVADVRDAGVVHEDMNAPGLEDFGKCFLDRGLLRNIAGERSGTSARPDNLLNDLFCLGQIEIQDANRGTCRGKSRSDGTADAAAAAGYHGNFSSQRKIWTRVLGIAHRDTPRFQGIKSDWP